MVTLPTIQIASLGMADSLILMVLALVVFGPRRLPQIGRQIGKLMYEFRKASNDFKFQMEEELRSAEEADRKKKEEERLSVLALAAPAAADVVSQLPESNPLPSGGDLSPGSLGAGTPDEIGTAAEGFMADHPYPGDDPYAAAIETGAKPEEAYPGIQPPSTGEQVPAARPGSLGSRSEADGPVEQTAAERDGIQPGHLPPEAVSSKEPPAKGPSPADFEEIRAHSAESPAVETVPDRERAHHG